MVAKEWRDARWKFAVAAVLVLLAVAVSPIPTPYGEISAYGPVDADRFAATEMWGTYSAGGVFVLLPLFSEPPSPARPSFSCSPDP